MSKGPWRNRLPFEERFWAKVCKTDSCWLWTGATRTGGYGAVGRNRKVVQAHRVAWEMAHGPIMDDLYVLHRCDTPSCVNPEHLFLGTAKDNMDDFVAKRRPLGITKTNCQ